MKAKNGLTVEEMEIIQKGEAGRIKSAPQWSRCSTGVTLHIKMLMCPLFLLLCSSLSLPLSFTSTDAEWAGGKGSEEDTGDGGDYGLLTHLQYLSAPWAYTGETAAPAPAQPSALRKSAITFHRPINTFHLAGVRGEESCVEGIN